MYTTPCIQRRYWYDDKREIIDIKFMYLETGVVENKRVRERERERDGKKCRWECIEKRLIGRQNHVK